MTFPFKNFIKKGEKYIVVENGRPEYVVMCYEDYALLIDGRGDKGEPEGRAAGTYSDFTAETVLSRPNLPQDISKIRLEDLPL